MFDKNRFKLLLEECIGEMSISDFALKSGVNRTYISQALNMTLEKAPSPKIIRKIADMKRNGITYEQLMEAAGHINRTEKNEDDEIVEMLARVRNKEQRQFLKKVLKSILDEE